MVEQANHKDTKANALPEVERGFAGYFVVAFVDLLGTETKNAEIKSQPEFPIEMLEREVAKVKAFQRDFYAVFNGAAQTEKELKLLRPENMKAALEKLQGNDVNSYAFSDSLIFHASLNTQQDRLVPVSSCFSILTALVCAQLWSLARGVPFRGGLEVGRAALFNGNQILGPALSDAVRLEKQAQFPRILIGKEFHKYLQLNSQLLPDTPESGANRAFAEICIGHICESDEPCQLHQPNEANEGQTRVFSLDVHSDFVAELIGEQHQALLNKARSFAEREIKRFSGHEEKLACRYHHLLNYLRGKR
ncbi:MAG: hypothetical protein HOO95_07285 [Gallionella sp.]|nr:hypothetical protein [Gallionella sp.]